MTSPQLDKITQEKLQLIQWHEYFMWLKNATPHCNHSETHNRPDNINVGLVSDVIQGICESGLAGCANYGLAMEKNIPIELEKAYEEFIIQVHGAVFFLTNLTDTKLVDIPKDHPLLPKLTPSTKAKITALKTYTAQKIS